MAAWAVIAVPLLIMFFALGMERVETRLRRGAVGENDVEEFFEQARPSELGELFRHGMGRAMELFRLRRRSNRSAPMAITAEEQTTEIIRIPADDQTTDVIPITVTPNADRMTTSRFRAS